MTVPTGFRPDGICCSHCGPGTSECGTLGLGCSPGRSQDGLFARKGETLVTAHSGLTSSQNDTGGGRGRIAGESRYWRQRLWHQVPTASVTTINIGELYKQPVSTRKDDQIHQSF